MAFPGNEMLRLSMDLATGTAGVLLALGTLFPFALRYGANWRRRVVGARRSASSAAVERMREAIEANAEYPRP